MELTTRNAYICDESEMPCHSATTAPHFAALKPFKHGFGVHELLGPNKTNSDGTSNGKNHPATFAIFALEKGQPVSFDNFPFDNFVTITEGEMTLEDLAKPEDITHVKAGDVLYVPQGSSVKWSTQTSCKGTYVQLKPLGDDTFHKGVY